MSLKHKVGKWISTKYLGIDIELMQDRNRKSSQALNKKLGIANAKIQDYMDRLQALSLAYETLEAKYNNVIDQRARETTPTLSRKKNQTSRKKNTKSTKKK